MPFLKLHMRQILLLIAAALICWPVERPRAETDAPGARPSGKPIVLGLDADFTTISRTGGEAVQHGILTAIAEINLAGGVLGRPLKLEVTDHRTNPRRGVQNFRYLVEKRNAVAIIGGVQSSVTIPQTRLAHEMQIPLVAAWSAATGFVDNGHEPNYAFRVSIRDQDVAGFLVGQALRRGHRRFALILENTPWGTSNDKALRAAIEATGLADLVSVSWLTYGDKDVEAEIARVLAAKPDAVFLVANAREGAATLSSIGARPRDERPEIFSHWGIASTDISEVTGTPLHELDLWVTQTYSFYQPYDERRTSRFFLFACTTVQICSPEDVTVPVGLAQAYDATHLVARAIEQAGSTEGAAIRTALQSLPAFDGLLKRYEEPFTPERHEALNRTDFKLLRFDRDGRLKPAECVDDAQLCRWW